MSQARLSHRLASLAVLRPSRRAAHRPDASSYHPWPRRGFQSQDSPAVGAVAPDFAFAFDIDGVLIRSSKPLPGAKKALDQLRRHRIPFILLTNGGGKHETERVAELGERLDVPLDAGLLVQSHTPFGEFEHLKDQTVLVLGGEGDRCRRVAEAYGFRHVVIPADIVTAHPAIWPFSEPLRAHYAAHARPLPLPLALPDDGDGDLSSRLRIAAALTFSDPRDWALDATLLLDLLLSHAGHLGTLSARNGDAALPHRGYQQDGQPELYFGNPDLWWAAEWHLPRLGQGGFRQAFEGVWRAATAGAPLRAHAWGKPGANAYGHAETALLRRRAAVLGPDAAAARPLRRVYMVGDNPDSDIRGANEFRSPAGCEWRSVLVRTGVYAAAAGAPTHRPTALVEDVWEAVQWGLSSSGWKG